MGTEQAMKVIYHLLQKPNLSYISLDCLFPITYDKYGVVRRELLCAFLWQVTIHCGK